MIKRTLNDTRSALSVLLVNGNGDPIDVGSLTVKFGMEQDNGTDVAAFASTYVTKQGTQTFTTSASTDKLTCNGHGLRDGWQVIVSSTTTLPAGLSASTRYFVRDATPNSFRLASEPNATAIDITDAGTGTHSFYVVGHVQYDFQSGDVDAAGVFYFWFQIVESSEIDTFPSTGRSDVNRLEIVEAL